MSDEKVLIIVVAHEWDLNVLGPTYKKDVIPKQSCMTFSVERDRAVYIDAPQEKIKEEHRLTKVMTIEPNGAYIFITVGDSTYYTRLTTTIKVGNLVESKNFEVIIGPR